MIKKDIYVMITRENMKCLDDIDNFDRSYIDADFRRLYPDEIGKIETGQYVFRFYPYPNVKYEKAEG